MQRMRKHGLDYPHLPFFRWRSRCRTNQKNDSLRRRKATRGERLEVARTGFGPRQPLSDLGMASKRVEVQLPGASFAYRFRPGAVAQRRGLKVSNRLNAVFLSGPLYDCRNADPSLAFGFRRVFG